MFIALLGATVISTSALFLKYSAHSAAVTGFYRMLVGALLLGVFVAAAAKGEVNRTLRDELTSKRFLVVVLLTGGFFTADFILWARSMALVGPGLATLLNGFQVLFVVFLRFAVFSEKPNSRQAAACPLALCGLGMLLNISFPGGEIRQFYAGLAIGLASAFFFACYLIAVHFLRRAAPDAGAAAIMSCCSVSAALCLGVIAALEGAAFAVSGTQDAAVLVGYGVVCQVVGWGLVAFSMKRISAASAGLAMLAQPCLTYVWDVIFFGKALTMIEVLGAVLVLGSVYLASSREDRSREAHEDVELALAA